MKLAAFILCLISTISMGFFLIPLAWCIPMTVKVYKAYKNNEPLSVGFDVCVLLFVNMIGGIPFTFVTVPINPLPEFKSPTR